MMEAALAAVPPLKVSAAFDVVLLTAEDVLNGSSRVIQGKHEE